MSSAFILKELTKDNIKEVFKFDINDENIAGALLNKEILCSIGLKYALIYNYDSVVSDNIENTEINGENIIEARFFSEDKEIRISNEDGSFCGTVFKEVNNQNVIKEEYILYPRAREYKDKMLFPSKLKVKKYFNYDEDGQAYISYVKPCEFIF